MHTMATRIVLGAFTFGLVLAAPGCRECTDIVCHSRLGITVREHEGAALQPGTWVFTVTPDGEDPLVATCEVGPSSRSAHCEGELGVTPVIFDDPDNPFTQFMTGFRGGDGLDGLPQTLDVEITHDDLTIHEQTYEPHYELTEPEHCDPDCVSDDIAITLTR